MSRGAFVPALAISVPSLTALNTLTLADVPVGTVATLLSTGDTYVIGTAGTWAAVGGSDAAVTDSIVTAGSNVTDLALAPAEWTLNGDTDGDYELRGSILFPAGSSATGYTLRINADSANSQGQQLFYGNVAAITKADLANIDLVIGVGNTNAGSIDFRAFLDSKSGRFRLWQCSVSRYDSTQPNRMTIVNNQVYTATSVVIGPTTTIHAGAAGHILQNSYCRIRRKFNLT